MQLNHHLTSARYFLENIGYMRLSAFYYPRHVSQHKSVQKVERTVLSLLALLGIYDYACPILSFKMKVLVRGSLVIVISCLALSFLLKGIQYLLAPNLLAPKAKRNLLSAFEEASKKDSVSNG